MAAFAFLYRAVLAKLVYDWINDGNYSHGFLIVPVAAYLVWERRKKLTATAIQPSVVGLVLLVGSLATLIAGILGAELFLSRVSMIGVLAGVVLFTTGWRYLRVLMFPLAFLLLMIPIPAIIFNEIAFPLQLLASRCAEWTLSTAHIPVLREGNIIVLANTTLEVAEACSGIRSLISLVTLAIIYGYFTDDRIWSRVVLTLAAIPVAVAANAARVAELIALIPNVELALAQCVEERQKFTDSIIGEIAKEVGKLYEKVHPGEGLDKIALELDPARRASLNLGATFEGHDAPPQAYFSQSHLDTLGLCVFLALAMRDRPQETVLILDDVLGSVDEPHVERVIGMIYEISTQFQHTIVTTHYRPWREKFRWGLLKPDQVCQFVELTTWSLTHGLVLSGSVPEIVRLKAMLKETPPDVQSICGKAGVILEAMLDFLTLKYGCAVPRRPGGTYTLGDLLPAINSKLLAALKVELLDHAAGPPPAVSAVELKPILEEITRIASARNVLGAHFNPNAFDLYPSDGLSFARHVERLADALICPDHGWPNNEKSGSYWRNGGDTRRLHPLKKPS